MARDLEQVSERCRIGPEEEKLHPSKVHPIVVLERRKDTGASEEVALQQKTLGGMLAYTPLHLLLLHATGKPLVMTSGNNSD